MAPWNRNCIAALAVAVVSSLLFSSTLLAGDLNAARKSAKGSSSSSNDDDEDDDRPKKRKRRKKQHHSHHHDHYDDDHGSFSAFLITDIFGPPILYAAASPWIAPAAILGDDYTTDADFPHYPYSDESDGYLVFGTDSDVVLNPYGVRYSSEYANDFSGLERIGGRLQLDSMSRFGFDTEWNHWREETPGGDDTLWTGDANLVFRFAQNEHAQFYTGLGMNWLGGGQSDVGFNFTYGFDWFPTEPFVIRSVLDMGTIGDADLYHNKTTIGLVYKHLELYTGYDILHIGDTNLQGMVGGVTIWW